MMTGGLSICEDEPLKMTMWCLRACAVLQAWRHGAVAEAA